jgi:diguanylate cyclase (GGDEF)-like protein
MYTFPQLLIRNSILALLFVVTLSLSSIFILSSLLEDKSIQHKQTISTLLQSFPMADEEADINQIANSLKKASNYNLLVITNRAGKTLIKYENDNAGLSLPFTATSAKKVNTGNIVVTYQLNHAGESSLLLTILVISFVSSFALVFFAAAMSTKRHKAVFRIISQQIKQDLALVNHTATPNINDEISNADILDIPELKEGIKDIKKLMTQQLESAISLEKEAYVDHLTKLDNRGKFVQFYENQIVQDSPVKFGVLIITRCSELQTINQIHGYKEGDNYISNVANIIKKSLGSYPDANLFRLNSSDFASVLPNVKLQEAEKLTKDLTAQFNEYQNASDLDSVAYSGLVPFDKTKPLGELLALADTGVSVAQTQSANSWYSQKDSDILQKNSNGYGNQNWRQEIDSVIENQRVTLLLQPIQPNGRNSKVYGEILARFLNSNDEMLPTASFIAMAEKLDKIIAVDKLIIETSIKEIISKNMLDQSFGINISARSISDEHFMIWLERKLLREPKVAPRLIFEITEYGLQQNIKTSKRLIDMLHRVGARVTVERFGVGLTSFKFFRDLTPDYIKMDSSYTRDIDDDKNNQYFLRLMVDLAHRLSINVLAESVESQEEKHTLEKLFIDGCQGFYIGKPVSL